MASFLSQKHAVIDYIKRHGEATRPEISRATGISIPTLSTLTRDLIQGGFITRDGYQIAPRGRRADKLIVNPVLCYAIGIQLSTTTLSGVVTDARGGVVRRMEVDDYKPEGQAVIVDALKKMVRELVAEANKREPVAGIAGIGVGASGLVRKDQKTSRFFPALTEWQDVPLGDILSEEFGVPVVLMNDVRAATLAEYYYGAARGVDNTIYIHMGRGMAMGIMADGRLYTGGNNYAGEIGHVVVEPQGPVCFCGNYGCLESLVAPSALVRQCVEALNKGVRTAAGSTPQEITVWSLLRAANQNDNLASKIVTAAGRHLGLALANLINVLNPTLVVMGGVLAAAEAAGFRTVTVEACRGSVLPLVRPETEFRPAELGAQACAVGAASAVTDKFFEGASSRLASLLERQSSSRIEKGRR